MSGSPSSRAGRGSSIIDPDMEVFCPSELPKGATLCFSRTSADNGSSDDQERNSRAKSSVMSRFSLNSRGMAAVGHVDTMFWMTTGFHLPSRREEDDDAHDDWDARDWCNDEEDMQRGVLRDLTPEQIEAKAIENLGLPVEGEEESFQQRMQRLLGLRRIRLIIERKRVKTDNSPPAFPLARTVCTSIKFEALVGLMILFNAVTIGWDSFYTSEDVRPSLLDISEHLFTALFLGEFALRVTAHTWIWMFDPMNFFDVLLIWVTGVFVMWVAPAADTLGAGFGSDVDFVRKLGCLRVLRLARLIRCIRMIPFFRELWILVKGVLDSFSLLVWSWVIIGTVHFMFAVIVLELVAKSETFDPELNETELNGKVDDLFGSVPRAMFSLFQIMTFDSWSGILRPMAKEMPSIMLIFGLFMGVAGIVLFNLMTAVVVKNAFDASKDDHEAQAHMKEVEERNFELKLKDMFAEMDEDGSGELSLEEFTNVLDDVNFIRTMKMLDIDLEELPDIFEILDDGDGQVSTDEFVNGIMRMQGPAMNKDMLKGTRMMNTSNTDFNIMEENMRDRVQDKLDSIEGGLDSAHIDVHHAMQMVSELLKKVDEVGVRRVFGVSKCDFPTAPKPEMATVLAAKERMDELERINGKSTGEGARKSMAAARKSAAALRKGAARTDQTKKKDAFELLAEKKGLSRQTPIPPAHAMRAQQQKRRQLFRDIKKASKGRPVIEEPAMQRALSKNQLGEEEEEHLAPGGYEEDWDQLGLELSAPEALRAVAKAAAADRKAAAETTRPPPPVLPPLPFLLCSSRPHTPEKVELSHPNAVPDEATDVEPPEMLI